MSNVWKDHPELVEKLSELAQDYSAGAIAKRLGHGLTRNAVIGKLLRMGIPLGTGGKVRCVPEWNPWTEETLQQLDALAAKGLTAGEIAARIGRPHWSVMKHAAARGIDLSPGAILKRDEPVPQRSPGGALLGLGDLGRRQCRWPHGDLKDGSLHFCGHHADEGHPYCAYHMARAASQAREEPSPGDKPFRPRTHNAFERAAG